MAGTMSDSWWSEVTGGGGGTLYGKSHEFWADKLGVGPEELQKMIAGLGRSVGTTQREGINRVGELSAANDLPIAAQLAMERGTQLSADRAITQGTAGIEQYGNQANRDAWSQIMSGEANEAQIQAQKDIADDQFWADLIGGAASAVPFL
jgi:hypothetical protein